MDLQTWLGMSTQRLHEAGIDSARLDAQMLAAHLFGRDRTWVIGHPEAEVNELAAEGLLQRREGREPLAYILGWREFYGRRFEVGPGVLVPRQETEALLETALSRIHEGPVLDLGTGSGCLAVTMKLERPEVEVWASDISPEALRIARRNAELHEVEVRFVESDLFASFAPVKFEYIVTNPPYIADSEELMPEVREFEPGSALFSGPSGLEFYERLAREAKDYLAFNGKVIMEVGHTQALAVVNLFGRLGWPNDGVVSDLSGVDRVVVCTRPD